MDRVSAMTVFAKVVETGGFSAAARALRLSKSAVSKQVAGLENRLGARLLNRTTRRLALTEVGAAYYARCQRILAEIDEAESAVTHLHGAPRGVLRVSAPLSFGTAHLAPCLPGFLARYRELRVHLELNDRFVDLVEDGIDVALRIGRLTDSSLIARTLAPARAVVCASPDYWAHHGTPRHPRDLAAHNCLLYTYQISQNNWQFLGAEGPVQVAVDGTMAANNGEFLRQAALKGLGVAFLPTFIVGEDLRAGRLVAALDDFESGDRAIHAVYPHNRHLSAKVRAFVDFLAATFGPHPYWDAPD